MMLKLWARIRGIFSSAPAQAAAKRGKDALDTAQEALQSGFVDRPQAVATRDLAEAAAALINSTKDVPEAVARIGQLALVKRTVNGKALIITLTISTQQARELDAKPLIDMSPDSFLRFLGHTTVDHLPKLVVKDKDV